MVAAPATFVVAVAGLQEPAIELITVKETVTLGTAAPVESLTVAVTAAKFPLVIVVVVAVPNVTRTEAGVPAPPLTGTPVLLLLMLAGEQPNADPSRTTSPNIAINLICFITTSKA